MNFAHIQVTLYNIMKFDAFMRFRYFLWLLLIVVCLILAFSGSSGSGGTFSTRSSAVGPDKNASSDNARSAPAAVESLISSNDLATAASGAAIAASTIAASAGGRAYEDASPRDPLTLRASSNTTCCIAPTTTLLDNGVLHPFHMKGRLGNSIFQVMVINMLARRYDLRAVYKNEKELCSLGIQLWSGSQIMIGSVVTGNYSYQQALVQNLLSADAPPVLPGVLVLDDYFQFPWMANRIREYFRDALHAPCLRAANPWRNRIDANNDTFVHVRLGDLENIHERDVSAYVAAIGHPQGAVYISSDSPQHKTVKGIAAAYPQKSYVIGANVTGGNMSLIEIMQFGASCAHLVISDGSFSWMIGALSSRYTSVRIVPRDILWTGNITMADWVVFRR